MTRPRAVLLTGAAFIGTMRLMACGSQDELYEERPATTTAPRCGEAGDPRCEP
jgi:hypothetical protein